MSADARSPSDRLALLDAADSQRHARPLRSWSNARQALLSERLEAVYRAWSAEWFRENAYADAAFFVEVRPSDDGLESGAEEAVRWSFEGPPRRAPASGFISPFPEGSASETLRAIGRQLFGSDTDAASRATHQPAGMASAVVAGAWEDWLARLRAALGGGRLAAHAATGETARSPRADPWSGTLHVHWPWCGGIWRMDLPHTAVATLTAGDSADAPPVALPAAAVQVRTRLDHALNAQRVALQVRLDGTRLSLGHLQGLRIGDIVPLNHALSAPAHVVDGVGYRVCDGWLGQADGHIAVELALAPSSGESPRAGTTHMNKGTA